MSAKPISTGSIVVPNHKMDKKYERAFLGAFERDRKPHVVTAVSSTTTYGRKVATFECHEGLHPRAVWVSHLRRVRET